MADLTIYEAGDLNIFEVWCLDAKGRPNCPEHKSVEDLGNDLLKHFKHLQASKSESERSTINKVFGHLFNRGVIIRDRLQEMLDHGDPSKSTQCCRPNNEGIRRWCMEDKDVQDWLKNKNLPENTLKALRTLQYCGPWDRVRQELETASNKRRNGAGRGVCKNKMIVPKDCKTVLGNLKAANSVNRDNRSDTSTPESLLSARQANPLLSDSTIPADDNRPPRKRKRTVAAPTEIQSGGALNNSPIISAADSESCSERTRSLFAITKIDIESLSGMAMLSSTVIFALLRFVEEIVGIEKAKVIDPLHISNSHTDIHPNAIILIPYLMEDSHWVIGIIREDRSRVDVFDSRPSTKNDKAARQKIMEFYTRSIGTEFTPAFNHSSPLRQSEENEIDSGVYVIMAGMYQMIGEPIPTWVDVPGCRRFLLSLVHQDSCSDDWDIGEALKPLKRLRQIGKPNDKGEPLQVLLEFARKRLEDDLERIGKSGCSPFAKHGLVLIKRMKAFLPASEVHSTDVEIRLQEAEKVLEKEEHCLRLQMQLNQSLELIKTWERSEPTG